MRTSTLVFFSVIAAAWLPLGAFAAESTSGMNRVTESEFSEKSALGLQPSQISFIHQENVEPWDSSPCFHKLSTVGLFEWDLVCLKNGKYQKYGVHLVLNRYPKTRLGGAGYELLYWITDWTNPRQPKSTSNSLFMHMATLDERAIVIESATGIENDMASLRLTIDLRNK